MGLTNVTAIAAGGYHSLALRSDGALVAWGDLQSPGFVQSNLVAIGSGISHGLAIRAGRLTPLIPNPPTDGGAPAGTNFTYSVSVDELG